MGVTVGRMAMGPLYFPKSDVDKIERMRKLIEEKQRSKNAGRGARTGKELVKETTSGNSYDALITTSFVLYY